MVRRGSFTAPGTRVGNVQTDKSQYITYVIQAIIIGIGGDIILLSLISLLLTVGWPILFVASLFIAYYGTLGAISLFERFTGNSLTYQESMRVAWGFVFSIAISDYFYVVGWWDWLICKEMLMILFIETFSPLRLPSWIYYSLTGLWFFGALKKWGKITFIAIITILAIWTISQIDYTVDFDLLWSRVRYFSASLILPWILASLILIIAMFKEMVAPNLNFILETIPWADYKQAGGIVGLLLPKWVEWKEKLENRVSYNITVNGRKNSHGKPTAQKRRTLFAPASDGKGLAKFAQAIFNGQATFSERGNGNQKGATDYGYTQASYKELRTIALKLGLADKKGNKCTLNNDGIEALEGVIQRVYPPTP